MSLLTGRRTAVGALAAGALATVILAAGLAQAAGPVRVEIRIRYSHFEPSIVRVPVGRPVTFVLVNDDPIDHEWIVAGDAVQERHRTGTEAHHDSRPTEVTVAALSTRETTVTFSGQVTWRYICHLPGHEAYGMIGTLVAS